MNTSKKIALHAKVEALQAIVILYPFVSWLPLENSLSQVGAILSTWNPAWSQHRPEVMTTVVYVSEEWKLFKNATEIDIWNDCWTQWKRTDSYLEEAGISQQVFPDITNQIWTTPLRNCSALPFTHHNTCRAQLQSYLKFPYRLGFRVTWFPQRKQFLCQVFLAFWSSHSILQIDCFFP